MADSDEDNDRDNGPGMSLAGFMFGNIDENGWLEDDILDSGAKKHLSSLCQLGLGSILNEMISDDNEKNKTIKDKNNEKKKDAEEDDDDYDEDDDDGDCDGGGEDEEKKKENNVDSKSDEKDETDYVSKSPSAQDFSDINELADDCVNEQIETKSQDVKTDKETDYDADDEDVENKQDKELMPPPQVPEEKESLTPEEAEAVAKRKLETPLASMLPSKYVNVDITELFPDFRPGKVLRFSKLFGPGKPSSLPQVWRSVKKRRKKKKYQEIKSSDSGSDQEKKKFKFKV